MDPWRIKNNRRLDLIHLKFNGGLDAEGEAELEKLQHEIYNHMQTIDPRPTESDDEIDTRVEKMKNAHLTTSDATLRATIVRERKKTLITFIRCVVAGAVTKVSVEMILTESPVNAFAGLIVFVAFWWWLSQNVYRELTEGSKLI